MAPSELNSIQFNSIQFSSIFIGPTMEEIHSECMQYKQNKVFFEKEV